MDKHKYTDRKRTGVRVLSFVLCLVIALGTLPSMGLAADVITISFNANGGSGAPPSISKMSVGGAAIFVLPQQTPTRAGYNFDGWYMSSATDTRYYPGSTVQLNSNTTMRAAWTRQAAYNPLITSVTLSFAENGGEGAPGPQTRDIAKGQSSTFTVPAQKPVRAGYTFTGWKEVTGTTGKSVYQPGESITIAQDTTLYALWSQNDTVVTNPRYYYYTITYYGQGADSTPPTHSVTSTTANATMQISTRVMTRPGYHFMGWAISPSGTPVYKTGQTIQTAHSLYLYAIWDKAAPDDNARHVYTITYMANGGSGGPGFGRAEAYGSQFVTRLSDEIPTRTGARFKGWGLVPYGEPTYQPGDSILISGDMTLYALWERDTTYTYVISYVTNSSTVSNMPKSQTVSGTTNALTFTMTHAQPTRPGYTFVGWAESPLTSVATYTSGQVITLTRSMTLYPVWAQSLDDRYTLTFSANGGSGAPQPLTALKTGSGLVTIPYTEPVRPGYTFIGWSTSANGVSTMYRPGVQIQLSDNMVLFAAWQAASSVSLTVHFDANGGSGAPYTVTADRSGRVTLPTARPFKNGYSFMGWATERSGYVRYQPGDTIYIARSMALYAVWGAQSTTGRYMVTYNANGGTNTPAAHYGENSKITLTTSQPTRGGYAFLGWNVNANANAAMYAPGQTIVLTRNMVLYAVWAAPNCSLVYDANGGTGGPGVQTVQTNATYAIVTILSGTPVRTGWSFAGWSFNQDGSGTRYYPGSTVTITPNSRIYAVWVSNGSTGGNTGGSTSGNGRYSYTIYYNGQGASSTPQRQTFSGNNKTIPAQISAVKPVKDGCIFQGWAITPQGDPILMPGQAYNLSSNLNLFAVWLTSASQEEFQVNFDPNGGTGGPGTRWAEGEPGAVSMIIPSVVPTRYGYKFAGWSDYKDNLFGQYQVGSRIQVHGNMTLYAVWTSTDITCSVSYSANGGTNAPAAQLATGQQGNIPIQLSFQTPVRPGYDFKGWSEDPYAVQPSFQAGQQIILKKSTVLYAVWQKAIVNYDVIYDANGGIGGPGKGIATGTLTNATHVVLTTKPTRKGFVFKGWSESPYGEGTVYKPGAVITVAGQTTLYAVWEAETPKVNIYLKYDPNGGSGGPETQYAQVEEGRGASFVIPREVPERENYIFKGWSATASGIGTIKQPGDVIMLSAPQTVYAVWEFEEPQQTSYAVTFWDNGGKGGPGVQTVTTVPNFTAPFTIPTVKPTREGYRFIGWSDDPQGATNIFQPGMVIGVRNSMTLYAIWKPMPEDMSEFRISYYANGGTSAPQPQTVVGPPTGTTVRLTAETPVKSGYIFKGWCRDRAGISEIYQPYAQFTLKADTMLYAIWEKAQSTVTYTITYDAGNGLGTFFTQTASGIPGNVQAICCGDEPYMPDQTFIGWSVYPDGDGILYHAGDAIPVPGNMTLYGQWSTGENVKQFRFYFDAMGGIGAPQPIIAEGFGSQQYIQVQMPASTPVKNGYAFIGWSDVKNPTSASWRPGETAWFPMEDTWNKNHGLVTLYAVWSESILTSHYNIIFNAGGGTGGPVGDTAIGDIGQTMYTLPLLQPTRPGWSFAGWALTPNATRPMYQPGQTISIEQDTTFYAVWGQQKPQTTATLSFDANGGAGAPAAVTQSGDFDSVMITIPENVPVKADGLFAGWSDRRDALPTDQLYLPGQQVILQGNVTLYAIWSQNNAHSWTITLDWNNGTNMQRNEIVNGTDDVLVLRAPASPTWSGHTFSGWAFAPTGLIQYTPGQDIEVHGNMTLYAIWDQQITANAYPIYFDSMGGVFADGQSTMSIYAWGTPGNVTAYLPSNTPTRPGYRFLGWSTSQNADAMYQPGQSVLFEGSVRLYAVWEQEAPMSTYYVYFSAYGASNTPANTSVRGYGSADYTLPYIQPTSPGLSFTGWKASDTNRIYMPGDTVALTSDVIFTACWA